MPVPDAKMSGNVVVAQITHPFKRVSRRPKNKRSNAMRNDKGSGHNRRKTPQDLQMLSSATLYVNVFVKGGTGEGH